MKTLVSFILFMVLSGIGLSQPQTEKISVTSIKIYANLRYDENRDIKRQFNNLSWLSVIEEKNLSIGKLSIALEKPINDNWFHEVELFLYSFDFKEYYQTDYFPETLEIISSPTTLKSLNIHVITRYQILYSINVDIKRRFIPFIGASTGLRYNCTLVTPLDNHQHPTNITNFTIPLEAVIGMKYRISERINLCINIPVELNNFNYNITRTKTKNRLGTLYVSKDLYGTLLPKTFNLRFGLSYKF